MIDLYAPSFLLLSLCLFVALPIITIRRYKHLGIILFFILFLLASVARPYIEGIDNAGFISLLTNERFLTTDLWSEDFIKYGSLFFISYLIPGTWLKLAVLNITITALYINNQYNFIKGASRATESINGSFVFLLLSYNLIIIPPLMLIHFKQYVAFVIVSFLCFRLPDPITASKNNSIETLALSCLVLIIHPAYIGFIIFYYAYINLEAIKRNFFRQSYIWKMTVLICFASLIPMLVYVAPNIFFYITNILPGFKGYALETNQFNMGSSIFSYIYPFVLPLPVVGFVFFSRPNKAVESSEIVTRSTFMMALIVLYIMIACVSYTEFMFSSFYSIGRVKSSLYPALILMTAPLYKRMISSANYFYILWLFTFAISILVGSHLIGSFN